MKHHIGMRVVGIETFTDGGVIATYGTLARIADNYAAIQKDGDKETYILYAADYDSRGVTYLYENYPEIKEGYRGMNVIVRFIYQRDDDLYSCYNEYGRIEGVRGGNLILDNDSGEVIIPYCDVLHIEYDTTF
jgi:hypothetical protein